ncbi:aquaporin-4-like [Spodoptera litura]|uniref:Aquaporin-4-like n=1 Tax=Spodoptera litura TaxID=69820 RepID=A0A9J7E7B2_SPOLT|nr:aquaporin-4-like [Spodoptera litura]XP_022825482.1 aquaporin-4-like [Spodoptera litura]
MNYKDMDQERDRLSCCAKWRGVISEFVATLILIMLGCMTCLPIKGIDTSIYAPFGFGCLVAMNVQIFGHISGAFMNPVVVLASVIRGNTSFALGIAYTLAECAGAIVGYGILDLVTEVDIIGTEMCVTKPLPEMDWYQTFVIEIAITGTLSFVCMSVWDPVNVHNTDSTSIKFGFTILGLILAAGPMTGASMNPARSLGPAVWTGQWAQHWVYWAGPLTGSGAAAFIYKYILTKR